MLELVDHVAALTEYRDREALDIGLAQTFMVLFKPLKVAIYSVVSDAKYRLGAADNDAARPPGRDVQPPAC